MVTAKINNDVKQTPSPQQLQNIYQREPLKFGIGNALPRQIPKKDSSSQPVTGLISSSGQKIDSAQLRVMVSRILDPNRSLFNLKREDGTMIGGKERIDRAIKFLEDPRHDVKKIGCSEKLLAVMLLAHDAALDAPVPGSASKKYSDYADKVSVVITIRPDKGAEISIRGDIARSGNSSFLNNNPPCVIDAETMSSLLSSDDNSLSEQQISSLRGKLKGKLQEGKSAHAGQTKTETPVTPQQSASIEIFYLPDLVKRIGEAADEIRRIGIKMMQKSITADRADAKKQAEKKEKLKAELKSLIKRLEFFLLNKTKGLENTMAKKLSNITDNLRNDLKLLEAGNELRPGMLEDVDHLMQVFEENNNKTKQKISSLKQNILSKT